MYSYKNYIRPQFTARVLNRGRDKIPGGSDNFEKYIKLNDMIKRKLH